MRFYPKIRAAALTAVTVTALVGGSLSAPAQAEVDSGRFLNYSAPNGSMSSQYHVYADGIDWAQPVGVVFYFDGDYWNSNKSNVYNPDSNTMQQMAQIANEKNMVFVPIISPDKDSSGDGITWWQNIGENGEFFRSFAQEFIADSGIDSSQVWTMGYSGGAEFITNELNASRRNSWRTGGGSIMVGGGGAEKRIEAPDSIKPIPMFWWVNCSDTDHKTNPPRWSAADAANQGYKRYTDAGFDARKDGDCLPGQGHLDYDLPGLLRRSLEQQ